MSWNWKRLPFLRDTNPGRGIIFGESVGKTTLLYAFLGNTNIFTIPTIGFNVEECTVQDGSKWKSMIWDIGGGCGKMQPLFRHYLAGNDFCIFLHDATENDEELVKESLSSFKKLLDDSYYAGCKIMWVVLNKQDLFKSADERSKKVGELVNEFKRIALQFADKMDVRVMHLPGFSAQNISHAQQLLNEIRQSVQEHKEKEKALKRTKNTASPAKPEPMQEDTSPLVQALVAFESHPADLFWARFLSGTLELWDHVSHLRAGFGVIVEGYTSAQGLSGWANDFLAHLYRLRIVQPGRFRNTAHRTMTLFWLHRIFRALNLHMDAIAMLGNIANTPRQEDFPEILKIDPDLLDKDLWRKFYSPPLMFSQRAKDEWCLPDMAMLSDTDTSSSAMAPAESRQSLYLPRFAFSVIKTTISSGASRNEMIRHALVVLQQVTMRKRASTLKQTPSPYSETKAYFWFQYLHICFQLFMSKLPAGKLDSATHTETTSEGQLDKLTFAAFQTMFRIRGDEWKEFYSEKQWDDMPARSQLVLPDRKPLPNVSPALQGQAFTSTENTLAVATINNLVNFGNTVYPPVFDVTEEELAFYSQLIIDEAEKISCLEKLDNSASESDSEKHDHQTTIVDRAKRIFDMHTRADLLFFVFHQLTSADVAARTDFVAACTRTIKTLHFEAAKIHMTHAFFWVQTVANALVEKRTPESDLRDLGRLSFREFMNQNPILALDDLPSAYYSPEVWNSAQAGATIVKRDRETFSCWVLEKNKELGVDEED